MTIRILLADDHQIVCDGLRLLIERQPDMEVVGTTGNGRQAVRLVQDLRPDVVIMDISMPDLNGIEATRQILQLVPGVKVIALSMHSDKRYVSGMLSAGASGYLLKECAAGELADAVRTVMRQRIYLSPSVTGVVVQDYLSMNVAHQAPAPDPGLTAREREVLQLLAEGRSTRQIAATLHLSPKTIETHRRNLMQKLDLHNVADITKYAIRTGLTDLER